MLHALEISLACPDVNYVCAFTGKKIDFITAGGRVCNIRSYAILDQLILYHSRFLYSCLQVDFLGLD